MGNTIKITKSKSFTYKKLNFLYLIFLVFMFFSNTGEYLRHYPALLNTQQNLNQRLTEKLNMYAGSDEQKNQLKEITLEYLLELSKIEKAYNEFKFRKKVEGKRSFDHDFVNEEFRFGDLGRKFESASKLYSEQYQSITKKDITADFVKIIDDNNAEFDFKSFYFQDLPNIAFETVLEHFKSLALYNSIIHLFDEEFSISKAQLVMLNQAKFIQKIKTQYSLGEKVELVVKADDSKSIPSVKVNGKNLIPKKLDTSSFVYSYVPTESGIIPLEVLSNGKRVLTSIEVSKPEFSIETEKSTFDGVVGEKFIIRLQKNSVIPAGSKLISSYADVTYSKGEIAVIPTKSGKISIQLNYKGEIVDEFFVYAHQPEQIEVSLQDIAGNNSNITQAYRLESTNTFWQVVGFRMTVVEPNGNKKTLKSATRFLRNELKALESKAVSGSTIVFDEIRVIGKEKGLTNMGRPIIFVK
jgi:hypothetical protein